MGTVGGGTTMTNEDLCDRHKITLNHDWNRIMLPKESCPWCRAERAEALARKLADAARSFASTGCGYCGWDGHTEPCEGDPCPECGPLREALSAAREEGLTRKKGEQ
jgi:hypothetical protein